MNVKITNRKIDIFNVNSLKKRLVICLKHCDELILDLKNVKFISTRGFNMLRYIQEYSERLGKSFSLCNVNKDVLELIKLIDFNIIVGD